MEVKVNFLDNLRLEARFDDFTVIADQPIRYKGDGSAPGPFDYFLASSALCAAYFVKLYCQTRNIPTDNIRLSQNNIVDPENRYRQIFKIQVELPADISEKDRQGILRSIDRCTVKKVVQTGPEFVIEEVDNLDADAQALLMPGTDAAGCTRIPGKDLPLEQTIANLSAILAGLGMKIEIASWRNIVPNVWSLHIRDAQSPMCFTNGKGASKESALASALGEFIERLNCNFFYNDQYWGEEIANAAFVHYPDERWFKPGRDDALPLGLLDGHCLAIYDPDGELRGSHLYDTNSGNVQRGICALPFVRQSDGQVVYFLQPDREPLPQQRHERRQYPGRGAGAVPVGDLRARGQAANPRRRAGAAGRAAGGAGQVPGHPRRDPRPGRAGLPGTGQGRLAGRRIPGDVRDPDESAHRWRVRFLRRPPELRGGPGA